MIQHPDQLIQFPSQVPGQVLLGPPPAKFSMITAHGLLEESRIPRDQQPPPSHPRRPRMRISA